jgi:homoserine/homoserine lactone efflux protein
MSLNFILLFSMTVFVASIIPGPSMLLALTHGMHHGAKRTMASAMGNVSVTLIQASVSIAGLGTVLIASETVFQIIKWAGAAYLIYLGVSMLLSSKMVFSPTKPGTKIKESSLKQMFFQAGIVTAGNPKAIVFFTAIFPQFLNPDLPFVTQFSTLLGIISILAFTCFMLYAMCGQKLVSIFSKGTSGKYIMRIIGSTFIGAGISLAISSKN